MVLADYVDLEKRRIKLGMNKTDFARINGLNVNTYRRATNEAMQPRPTNGNGHKQAAEAKQEAPRTADNLPKIPAHRPRAERRLLRSCVLDIETLDFDAVGYAGIMTTACVLPLDSDDIVTVSLHFEDHGDDRRALVDLFREIWKYDTLIWQNGAAFDANWLNTKRIYYGMPDLRSWIYFDTYQVARNVALASGGKSLGNLIDFFGLTAEKTAIRKTSRSYARSWDRQEFDAMMANDEYHCQQDVLGQRELFDVLFPYSMGLRDNPFKMTKWKVGVPDFDGWMAQWEVAQRKLKEQRAEELGGGGRIQREAVAAGMAKG